MVCFRLSRSVSLILWASLVPCLVAAVQLELEEGARVLGKKIYGMGAGMNVAGSGCEEVDEYMNHVGAKVELWPSRAAVTVKVKTATWIDKILMTGTGLKEELLDDSQSHSASIFSLEKQDFALPSGNILQWKDAHAHVTNLSATNRVTIKLEFLRSRDQISGPVQADVFCNYQFEMGK